MNLHYDWIEMTAIDGTGGRRRKRWLLAAGAASMIAVLGVGGYWYANSGSTQTSATSRPSLTVTVVTPQRSSWAEELEALGAIAPWEEASVGTQIGGYQLTEVRVNVGDQVRRGQVLARLNPALLKADEAQLLARADQARANDRRAQGLKSVGGISEQEALQAATDARTAAAALAANRLQLRYTAVIAPDDGVISARTATVGAVVAVGQELFRMIRRNRLEWRGELTDRQLGSVRRGQGIDLQLADGTHVAATVREIAPSLDTQARVAIVYADIPGGSPARAGMYVNGRIRTGVSSALVVPAPSVVVRDGRSYVTIVRNTEGGARVSMRQVATGRRNARMIEIVRGLKGNERLVDRGGAFLNNGDAVRVVSRKEARL